MAQTNSYTSYIENAYLGKSKIVKASSKLELNSKISTQLSIWADQERRARERENVEQMKATVSKRNEDLSHYFDSLNNILKNGLRKTLYNYEDDFNNTPFGTPQPTIEEVYLELNVPKSTFWERIFPSIMQKRTSLEATAKERYEILLSEWTSKKDDYCQSVALYNQSVSDRIEKFKNADVKEVETYFSKVLTKRLFPICFSKKAEVLFSKESQALVVNYFLPRRSEIEHTKEYKYVTSEKKINEIELKPKDFDAIYNNAIKQIALSVITDIFYHDQNDLLDLVVFNGMLNTINTNNGKPIQVCIITVQMTKEKYTSSNFSMVEVSDCLDSVKAIYSKNIAELVPVKPIMEFNRDDKRFISNADILDSMDSKTNLAEMDWEEFEHLIRDLFAKYFSTEGSEVKVTQASRDGGIDAVAFDPDPIRGGKFVIQAKRYNNIVPLSAVRDLYGTMINEGAAKGILVTTSYYGKDSLEFVKNKPMTLIDGKNLLYLLSQFGYDFQIKLRNKV